MWHKLMEGLNIGLKIFIKLKSMMKVRKPNVPKQLYAKFLTKAHKKIM